MLDYAEYVFIFDKQGNEYDCQVSALKAQVKSSKELNEEEQKKCMNIPEIISTDRI